MLERNISCLFSTARLELLRKDGLIARLREQCVRALAIRRGKRPPGSMQQRATH